MTHDSWTTSQPKKIDTLSQSVFFHNTRLHNSQAWVPLRLLQHGGIVSCHCVGGSLKVLFHVAHHPSQRQLQHSLEGWIHGDSWHSFLIWEARLHENLNHLTILANLISKHLEGCYSQVFDLASLLMLIDRPEGSTFLGCKKYDNKWITINLHLSCQLSAAMQSHCC